MLESFLEDRIVINIINTASHSPVNLPPDLRRKVDDAGWIVGEINPKNLENFLRYLKFFVWVYYSEMIVTPPVREPYPGVYVTDTPFINTTRLHIKLERSIQSGLYYYLCGFSVKTDYSQDIVSRSLNCRDNVSVRKPFP